MPVSMSSDAHYVTQQSLFAARVFVKGPLTDKAIRRYEKMGYYGTSIVALARLARQKPKVKKAKLQTDAEKKRNKLKELLEAYV